MTWRPIDFLENIPPDRYVVSKAGEVRRVDDKPRTIKVLTASPNSQTSYPYVFLFGTRDGKLYRKYIGVHRLVAMAFMGPPPEGKPYVLHQDGTMDNYHLDNLRWGDASENASEYLRHHERVNSLTQEAVLSIRSTGRRHGMSKSDMARLFKVSKKTINDILSYRTWKHLP